MLAELEEHHRRTLSAIGRIARIVDASEVDQAELAAARLALSRASGDRSRFIVRSVYPALQEGASERLLASLEELYQDFVAQRAASSRHVTTWTSRAIEADQAGYQAASRHIRQKMIERIELEKRILYPELKGR